MNDLDARLLAAHAQDDRPALVTLYSAAAEAAATEAAQGFFLTQAYVYALEMGAPQAPVLRARLKTLGRED